MTSFPMVGECLLLGCVFGVWVSFPIVQFFQLLFLFLSFLYRKLYIYNNTTFCQRWE